MASLTSTAPRRTYVRAEHPKRHRPRLSTASLARVSAGHPWIVLLVWGLLLALAGVAAQGLGDALTTQVTMTNKQESTRADDLLATRLRPFEPVTETVVIRSDSATANDPAFRWGCGRRRGSSPAPR